MKAAVLLVPYGSTVEEARRAYDAVERRVSEAFPGLPIRRAYSSDRVRRILRERGTMVDSVEEALARMAGEGITHAAVQSLHVIPGKEFDGLRAEVDRAKARGAAPAGIEIGTPLLAGPDDVRRTADALLRCIPAERRPEEGVVFMGHGTQDHPGGVEYERLEEQLRQSDSLVFVGLLGGGRTLGEICDVLRGRGVARVWLIPFMTAAGMHIRADMAGRHGSSWAGTLEEAGFACVPVLKGAAECDEVADIWIDHLKSALERLETTR